MCDLAGSMCSPSDAQAELGWPQTSWWGCGALLRGDPKGAPQAAAEVLSFSWSLALPGLASSCLLSLSLCSWLLQLIKCLGGVWSSLLPGGVRNSHYGPILNVKWFQMFFYLLLLAVLEEGITLTFKLALALNFYAEWADTNRDLWTLKPAFLS